MLPAFQPEPELAAGLNLPIVEERPVTPIVSLGSVTRTRHFIEANTRPVDMAHLKNDCVVPVFSKDNEVTISHQSFVETVWDAAHRMFPQESIDTPDIVVSHLIKGRLPEALTKPVNHLLETDQAI